MCHDKVLKDLIRKNSLLGSEIGEINEDTDIVNDLALDSMAIVNLFVDIEEEFGIEIDIHHLNRPILDQYRVLKEYVSERMGGCS